MNFKKKVGVGVLTGVMGLSLIGGGTYAAFNDIETVNNSFASGTLDLGVVDGLDDDGKLFSLQNLKPGDTMTRTFELENLGSLAIKEVLLHMEAKNFDKEELADGDIAAMQADADYKGFLDQFQIEVLRVDEDLGEDWEDGKITDERLFYPIQEDDNFTLKDLYESNFEKIQEYDILKDFLVDSDWDEFEGKKLNLAPNRTASDPKTGEDVEWDGLPADRGDTSEVQISIKFVDDDERNDDGYYKQNKYQGNSIDVNFYLEATQWHGIDVGSENGYVDENERANPEDQN
ncbi:TasA family protein [Alkalibacillus haloalkaliphilus]|uniref:Spore coat-associated protein N n=1 Tax=Alkalibacillus haloalkaliphilus TaxID=94136 RepID=A0A511VZT2_9BACI|nr:TasA family protein [Alkalibacillus haloalkaliphilus]GEN44339.1 spore coat-associated protein N [Alkalibacillus haloalkaliphilus]